MISIKFGIKRAFDIVASLILILILIVIPVLIIVPIAIKLTSKGPAMFTQERIGKSGESFRIYKFRTMLLPEDRIQPDGSVLEPNDSITKVGNILRKTSLDELPQLFNIFLGHMSFVGPRPMIPSQVAKISDHQRQRHNMRPGVTGWAQVNGRNSLTWEQKLAYDLEYIEKFNLVMDIKIFFKTVKVIFAREGIEYVHTLDEELKKVNN